MATLKLVTMATGGIAAQSVDLLDTDITLERGTWRSRRASNGHWHDTLSLVVRSSTGESNIRAAERLLAAAQAYHADRTRKPEVWLHWQSDDDASEKRALVYGGSLDMEPRARFDSPIIRVHLTVERGAWELTTGTTSSATGISALGGTHTISGSAIGGRGARLAHLKIYGTAATPLTEVWAGVRGLRGGDSYLGNAFDPTLDLTVDATYSVDAGSTTDATAHGSSRVTVTFATAAGMEPRAYAEYYDKSDLYYGRYLVVARYKSPGTASGKIKLRYGNGFGDPGTSGLTEYEPVVYSATTDWRLLPLAAIDIPRQRGSNDLELLQLATMRLWVYASRTGGTGDLYLDTLTLVPLDVFAYMDQANVSLPDVGDTAKDGGAAHWFWGADGTMQALTTNNAAIPTAKNGVDYAMSDGLLPWDGAILVVLAQADDGAGGSGVSDTVDISVTYYPIHETWT